MYRSEDSSTLSERESVDVLLLFSFMPFRLKPRLHIPSTSPFLRHLWYFLMLCANSTCILSICERYKMVGSTVCVNEALGNAKYDGFCLTFAQCEWVLTIK